MKHPVVIKLRRALAGRERMPYWVDFIDDKSVVREHVNPEIDRLMQERAPRFWLPREYRLAELEPTEDEIREGLNPAGRQQCGVQGGGGGAASRGRGLVIAKAGRSPAPVCSHASRSTTVA